MNYISSKELSKLWGISQGRIIRLAREGRIEGAKKFGKTWLMPDNAVKPMDARTSAGKEASKKLPPNVTDDFRYPMYEFQDEHSFFPPLSADELVLKSATETFHSCDFKRADEILGDLPDRADNKYIKIAALFTGCMLDLYNCKTKRFFLRFEKLKSELSGDFPHKKEMMEYIHIIDSNLGFNEYFVNEFIIDSDYPYHETFIPRLANLSTVMFSFGIKKIPASILSAHELNCMALEKNAYYAELQSMDVYLGCAYASIGMKDKCNKHLKRALYLAIRYNMYFGLSFHYCYMPEIFEDALSNYSDEFKKRFSQICTDVHDRSAKFAKSYRPEGFFDSLSSRDFIIFYYVTQGLKIREIAHRLGVSYPTIARRLSDITAVLGVNSKAEIKPMYEKYLEGLK